MDKREDAKKKTIITCQQNSQTIETNLSAFFKDVFCLERRTYINQCAMGFGGLLLRFKPHTVVVAMLKLEICICVIR